MSEASKEKSRVHQLHLNATNSFQKAEAAKAGLRVKLERTIAKAQPYFDVQYEFQLKLEVSESECACAEVV